MLVHLVNDQQGVSQAGEQPPSRMHQIGLFPTLHAMWCLKNVTGSDRDDCVISE